MYESSPVATRSGVGTTLCNSASTTAPADNAALATLTAPPAGWYELQITLIYSATAPAAAEDIAVSVRLGAVEVIQSLIGPRANNVPITHRVTLLADGVGNISVNAEGAGTASVVYTVQLLATRIG
jgi:hypothetical protein